MFGARTRIFPIAHSPEARRKLPLEAISYHQTCQYLSANLQLVEGLDVH